MNNRTLQSIQYIFFSNLFSKGISFLGSILLARILYPADYGYLLKAGIINGFIQMFANIGFEYYYLQKKIDNPNEEKIILNLSAKYRYIVNAVLFFVQVIVSYIIEFYFMKPLLGKMVRIYAFTILLNAPMQLHLFRLRKQLFFKPESIANILRDITSTITKVSLAWIGFGPLSFAYGSLVGNVIRLFYFNKYYPIFIPNLKIKNKKISDQILFFGKHSFIAGIISYFNGQLDQILIGSRFNNHEAGLYSFSKSYGSMPFSYLIQPFSSFIVSYNSVHNTQVKTLQRNLSLISKFLLVLFFPIVILLTFYAKELFLIIFGKKWIEAIPIFIIIIIYNYFFYAFFFPYNNLLTAFGRPDLTSKLNLYKLLVFVVIIPLFFLYNPSIIFYALIYLIISLVFMFIKSLWGMKFLNLPFTTYINNIRNTILIELIILALIAINHLLIHNLLLNLIIDFLYIVIFIFSQKKIVFHIIKIIK